MKLRGRDLGNVFMSSGSRGSLGTGWKQDIFCAWHPGFNFEGSTTILKTMTVDERMPSNETKGKDHGNMVIDPNTLQPKDWFPDCVKFDLRWDRAANAVSLSNPGADKSFRLILLENIEKYVLSIMCVRKSKEARMDEAYEFRCIARKYLPLLRGCLGLEDNESCPNTGNHSADLDEILERLSIFRPLGLPQIVKLDNLATVEFIKELETSQLCDALEIPNSLKVGERPDRVNWDKLRYLTDPIAKKYGVCGYSGRENFLLAIEIIQNTRKAGVKIPIICGGISSEADIELAAKVKANAIGIGRATKTRFWRVRSLINKGNEIFGG